MVFRVVLGWIFFFWLKILPRFFNLFKHRREFPLMILAKSEEYGLNSSTKLSANLTLVLQKLNTLFTFVGRTTINAKLRLDAFKSFKNLFGVATTLYKNLI